MQDFSEKKKKKKKKKKTFVKLKITTCLLIFNAKKEMLVSVVNVIQYDFKRCPKFKSKEILQVKKDQNPNECCLLAFVCIKNAEIKSV